MSTQPESPPLVRIRQLEAHLRAYPLSPLFARLASSYIEAEQPERAVSTALEGIKSYPEYASAHLVLAEAYMMLRRYHDAREELKLVMQMLPIAAAGYRLEERSVQLEKEFPSSESISLHSIDSLDRDESTSASRRKKRSHRDDLIPGAHLFSKKVTRQEEFSPDLLPSPVQEDFDLEALAEELEHAKIPIISEDPTQFAPYSMQSVNEYDVQSRPITETLAAIYAQQGKYAEAIRAYQILRDRSPERAAEFDRVIDQLQSVLAARTTQS